MRVGVVLRLQERLSLTMVVPCDMGICWVVMTVVMMAVMMGPSCAIG